MTANFLDRAGAPSEVKDIVAAALLDSRGPPISPTAAVWVVRDAGEASESRLDLASLHVEGSGLGAIHVTDRNVLESDRVPFETLSKTPTFISVANGVGRGSITIEGVLSNAKLGNVLPPNAIRRRVFDANSGTEIDFQKTPLKVGDRLAVVVEGDKNRLAKAYGADYPPSEHTGEPLIVADLLPSALKIASETVLCRSDVATPSAVRKLRAVGDLRAIDTDADRWVALIVPSSRQAPHDGEGAANPQPNGEQAAPTPAVAADPCNGLPPEGPAVDFREAYLARVNLAGQFVWPGVSVEATTRMADTWSAEATTVNVVLPERPPK
jgi:hypothetical protein